MFTRFTSPERHAEDVAAGVETPVVAGSANLPGTAFDPTGTTGFLFAGLYNFCIGSTPTQIAARNAQALCGVRGTQFGASPRVPSFAGVNVDGNPNNDLLPFDPKAFVDALFGEPGGPQAPTG